MVGKKLYVGNLSYGVGSSDLEQIFSQFGIVQSAQVITDRETGRSKGFGFVEMDTDADAQEAIRSLHDQEHNGRRLTVNEARPREPRPGGGGGGYGGGGGGGGYGGGYAEIGGMGYSGSTSSSAAPAVVNPQTAPCDTCTSGSMTTTPYPSGDNMSPSQNLSPLPSAQPSLQTPTPLPPPPVPTKD